MCVEVRSCTLRAVSRVVRLSVLGLTSCLALGGCVADEEPEPIPFRYAYVVKAPGDLCGTIKVVEGDGEAAEFTGEPSNWDSVSQECQTRPVFGQNGELSWLTHEGEPDSGTWKIQIKRAGAAKQTLRLLNGVPDIGRLSWSANGERVGFYFQEPGTDYLLALFETAPGGGSEQIDLNQIAWADDEAVTEQGREMREVSFSHNGLRVWYPTYENMDATVPRFNMDVKYVEAHDDNQGFAEGHLTFDGILDYDRIRQAVWTSREDRIFVHGQTPEGVSHLLRVDINGSTRTPTVLHESGDADHWFSPLQVSTDGQWVAFIDRPGADLPAQAVLSGPSGTTILGAFPGEDLSWFDRKLQWIGSERLAYTVKDGGTTRIDVFDRAANTVTTLVEEEGMDVLELAWDPQALGREESASSATSGGADSADGGDATDGGGTEAGY